MAVKWIEARQKKSADPPWTSKVTLIVDEFIELETAFESASGAHRETVMIAGKILAVSPPTQHGIMLELSFIGSDDPETADKMKDSNVNFHLCQLKPRQDGCKVTTDGVLHSEKFRKLSINDVRALGYAPKAVLDDLAPPPPSSKQLLVVWFKETISVELAAIPGRRTVRLAPRTSAETADPAKHEVPTLVSSQEATVDLRS